MTQWIIEKSDGPSIVANTVSALTAQSAFLIILRTL